MMQTPQKQRQQAEDFEEVVTFRPVEDLQSAGINVSDIKKLKEHGCVTIGSVLQLSSRDLVSIKVCAYSSTHELKPNLLLILKSGTDRGED